LALRFPSLAAPANSSTDFCNAVAVEMNREAQGSE